MLQLVYNFFFSYPSIYMTIFLCFLHQTRVKESVKSYSWCMSFFLLTFNLHDNILVFHTPNTQEQGTRLVLGGLCKWNCQFQILKRLLTYMHVLFTCNSVNIIKQGKHFHILVREKWLSSLKILGGIPIGQRSNRLRVRYTDY